MTWEQIQRRDLAWEAMKQGYTVREADQIVGLILGPWRPLRGTTWCTREDSEGQEFQVWDLEMNDD